MGDFISFSHLRSNESQPSQSDMSQFLNILDKGLPEIIIFEREENRAKY